MTRILLIKIFSLSSQVKARHGQELLLQCLIPILGPDLSFPPSMLVQYEGCFPRALYSHASGALLRMRESCPATVCDSSLP